MPPYPNQFLPSKKTRDFCVADTVLDMSNTRILKVAAAASTIAPDTLVLLSAVNPDAVVAATTGTPAIGVDTVMGVSATYSNNTSTAAGVSIVAKNLPGMTYRVVSNQALTNQAGVDAIIGNRYFLTTTTDSDGFAHQVLDIAGGVEATSMLRVVDADFTTNTVLVQIVA